MGGYNQGMAVVPMPMAYRVLGGKKANGKGGGKGVGDYDRSFMPERGQDMIYDMMMLGNEGRRAYEYDDDLDLEFEDAISSLPVQRQCVMEADVAGDIESGRGVQRCQYASYSSNGAGVQRVQAQGMAIRNTTGSCSSGGAVEMRRMRSASQRAPRKSGR